MEEIYKDIKECEGFQISNLGKVKDVKTGKNKRVTVDKETGDRIVKLDGKDFVVHELVAKAFLEGNGNVIHIDGNKANNKVENLMYEVEEKEEIIEEKIVEENVIEVEEKLIEKEDKEVFIAKDDIKKEEKDIKTMKGTPRRVNPILRILGLQ